MTIPHVCSCQDITETQCTSSSTNCSRGFSGMCPRLQMIPMALLSGTQTAGFLQDPHTWNNTDHPTKPLLLQDRHLQQPSEDTTMSQNVGSLEVRRKLLQNWTRFYSVSAHRTGCSAKMLTTGDVFSTVTIQFRHSRTSICFPHGCPSAISLCWPLSFIKKFAMWGLFLSDQALELLPRPSFFSSHLRS